MGKIWSAGINLPTFCFRLENKPEMPWSKSPPSFPLVNSGHTFLDLYLMFSSSKTLLNDLKIILSSPNLSSLETVAVCQDNVFHRVRIALPGALSVLVINQSVRENSLSTWCWDAEITEAGSAGRARGLVRKSHFPGACILLTVLHSFTCAQSLRVTFSIS